MIVIRVIRKYINEIYIKYLRLTGISIGKNVFIRGAILFSGSKNVVIGNDVYINSCEKSNPIGGNIRCYFKTFGKGEITIQDGCRISNTAICSSVGISIGRNVYVGGDCRIYDTDFHSVKYINRIKGGNDRDIMSNPVTIKDGAFIGASSIILKGVCIGRYSVIAAGSVVTKDIPDNEIWGGSPAHFIRKIEE